MLGYYLKLALRSLRRNLVLTSLMILAIAVGISACMTTMTVFRAMSGDPIPEKSGQLFAVQIENWKPSNSKRNGDGLDEQLSYPDAHALMLAHAAKRQSAMYLTDLAVRYPDPKQKPTREMTRAVYADFFPMFDVPFEFGSFWSKQDDEAGTPVVVLAKELNDKLFGGKNSVGRTVQLSNQTYTVVGVLKHWSPIPHFYDLHVLPFGESDQMFVPFMNAINRHQTEDGSLSCNVEAGSGWEGKLRSECTWLQYWVELPTSADVQNYRRYLSNYAAEQRRTGRFSWPARTDVRDVRSWLVYNRIIPNEINILLFVSLGFLLVCLMNAMGLMLAKIMGRAPDIGVRRALGASRKAIFLQCLVETGVVGFAGGLLGLVLTAFGLLMARTLLTREFALLARLDLIDTVLTVGFAIVTTMLVGLYPTWRASFVQPAWQLKAQ
ncbi:MAG TPA: ABC transporter permease [Steroidobacteraceae bacterium]|jgi:putative ABC transport system permease protein